MRLLQNARTNLKSADMHLQKSKTDPEFHDSWFSLACYHIQQSIELFIKFVINYNGGSFRFTHNILDNLDEYNKLEKNEELKEAVNGKKDILVAIKDWSTDSRYKEDFFGSLTIYNEVYDLCLKFEDAYKDVKPEDDKDVRIKLSTLIDEMKCLCCVNYKKCLEERDFKDDCINSNYKNFEENK